MSRKAATTLAALLIFGTASAVLADANDRSDYLGSFGQRPLSMMSNSRTGAVNDAAKPFTTEKNASFAASEPALAQSVPFRRGVRGKTIVWIKLTEPSGNLIHINLEHITSIRSATLIPKNQGSTRFDERKISRRAGKRRAGHAVDLDRPRRSRERRNTKRGPVNMASQRDPIKVSWEGVMRRSQVCKHQVCDYCGGRFGM